MASIRRPTYRQLTRVLAAQGKTWRGGTLETHGRDGYQAEAARGILDPATTEAILQGPRQVWGKTDLAATLAQAFLLNGGTVTLGMPTQAQSAVVLRKRIVEGEDGQSGMKVWERATGLKQTRGDFFLSQWSNGGTLMVVNARHVVAETNLKPRSSQTGRTTHLLLFSEAQSMFDEDVRELLPFVNEARIAGTALVLYEGVGGPPSSVIEAKKKLPSHRVFHYNDERVRQDRPEAGPVLDAERENQTPEFYDSNYKCLPVVMGDFQVFPSLGERIVPTGPHAQGVRHYYGIDVAGMGVDRDVICHLEHFPYGDPKSDMGIVNILEFVEIPKGMGPAKARFTFDWIDQRPWMRDGIACETNGVGTGLHDDLKTSYFPYLAYDHIRADLKQERVHDKGGLRDRNRRGLLGVAKAEDRAHLMSCAFKIDERGKATYVHDDKLSALIVAAGLIGGGVGYVASVGSAA